MPNEICLFADDTILIPWSSNKTQNSELFNWSTILGVYSKATYKCVFPSINYWANETSVKTKIGHVTEATISGLTTYNNTYLFMQII